MVSSQSLTRPALDTRVLPSPTLLHFRDIKLQEVVEPREQLLSTESLVSGFRKKGEDLVGKSHLDSPMMGG